MGRIWQAEKRTKFISRPCAARRARLSRFDARAFSEGFIGDWFWPRDSCAVVKQFRYALDPLCLVCCALYALNRWGIKPHTHVAFLHFWFNDLLLIPCALPLLLQAQRWLKLRQHDDAPTAGEVFGHLALWSVLFELLGPHFMRVTGDWRDVLAYTVGGVGAYACWQLGSIGKVPAT
jgi:hypothetical protein